MLIANPIYDSMFKRLMENGRIARFFVETLIGEQVEELVMVPQEYTYLKRVSDTIINTETQKEEIKEEFVSVIRFDFVATIRTAEGENKKVLIEIQKTQKPTDVARFRTYLGEQYKRTDMIDTTKGREEKALPIISIYLLGFTISNIEAKAIRVNRTYIDMDNNSVIAQKCALIESLTHDGYFVQIPRISGKPRTLLDQLLSVFEQDYFIDEKNIVKAYEHSVDHAIIGEMINILRYAVADPKERKYLEAEWMMLKDEEGFEEARLQIKELQSENAKNVKTIAEKNNTIAEKDKELEKLRAILKQAGISGH